MPHAALKTKAKTNKRKNAFLRPIMRISEKMVKQKAHSMVPKTKGFFEDFFSAKILNESLKNHRFIRTSEETQNYKCNQVRDPKN